MLNEVKMHKFKVKSAMEPLEFGKNGMPIVDQNTQQSSLPWVFFGGDIGGVAETTVVGNYLNILFK
jgi:hypothetical protein